MLSSAPAPPSAPLSPQVEEMKKFVFEAKPRTRLDAYPLLCTTQDVMRRLANKEIKIISKRENELASALEKMTYERDHLAHRLELAQKELHDERIKAKLVSRMRTLEIREGNCLPEILQGIVCACKQI